MTHYNMAPKFAFLACSILVLLLEFPAPSAASGEMEEVPPSDEGLKLTRAKRQLIGTPNLPLTDPKRKRPFCNAFTGCGKKRSDGPVRSIPMGNNGQFPDGEMEDSSLSESESLATLVELNSEPAVAELNRQILSEAKLWEAIQEALQEITLRRKQKGSADIQSQRTSERHPRGRPSPYEMAGIRKRREAPPAIPKGTLPSAGNGALPIV